MAITSTAGVVVERLAYDPWGKRRFINGTADTLDAITGVNIDRGFTMHEHIDEMGIINMNGRIYDPLIGRFMSADPKIQAASDLQSFNRYAYVRNNPLNKMDPSGFIYISNILYTTTSAIAAIFNAAPYVPPLASVAPVYAIQATGAAVNAPQATSTTYYSSQGIINVVTNVAGGELNGVARIGYFSGAMPGSINNGLMAILGGSNYYYAPINVICINNICQKSTYLKQNSGLNAGGYRGPGASVTVSSNGTTIIRAGVGLGAGVTRVSNVQVPGDDTSAAGTFGFTIGGAAVVGSMSCSARCSAGFQFYTDPITGLPTGVKYFESCNSDCSITGRKELGLKVEGDFGVEASKNGEVTDTKTEPTSETTSTSPSL